MVPGLLVIDFGSQYTLLIAKKLRELGFYNELIDGFAKEPPKNFEFSGIILSGGPDQVSSQEGRTLPSWVKESKKPILGICYGMQLLVDHFGGVVKQGEQREFGQEDITWTQDGNENKLFAQTPSKQTVWMSHGDHIEHDESVLKSLAYTKNGVIAAIRHVSCEVYGLQFHPEVVHTQWGSSLLKNFATNICHLQENWSSGCILKQLDEAIKKNVGGEKVLLAVSGGVDSTVAALVLTKALSFDQVSCVLIDHGFMRKDEVSEVSQSLKNLGLNLEVLDEKELFMGSLKGVDDPEEKRKIIGKLFVESFEKFAKSQKNLKFLGQGTLYSDVIESAGDGSGSKVIKSHHNVGGLPERLNLKLIEPFRFLFKDEVRNIGLKLGLKKELIERHPFPGPGLAIRLPGQITEEKISILQEADKIFIDTLKEHGLYDSVWQAAVILLPVKSVGVMGDNRTYQWTCVLRAVTSIDAMTAKVSELPFSFLNSVSTKIVRKVDGINRVLYDITSKPPATIEWE